MDAAQDRIIGGFRIVRAIKDGSGSQGTVYEAVCVDGSRGIAVPGTRVALKVMAAHENGGKLLKRLKARTSLLMTLNHPNIVRYLGCFAESSSFADLYVVVEEFLEGETLKDVLVRSVYGLDVDECVRIATFVISALEHSSANGIVHRDVKPANIFICRDGGIKLIDFEIAYAPVGTTASSTHNFKGSFDYMAPEFSSSSFRGDVQSDVFAMGVVLHEMLTGQLPYHAGKGAGNADFEFLSRWSSNDMSPIRINTKINRILARASTVLLKALSPDREHRYHDFTEFLADLSGVRMKNLRNGGSTYQLLQFIGKGGFGEVFKARVRETGRIVAIKHLLKAEYAERFCREARIMSQLDNPCFVRLVDFFFAAAGGGREAFIVMDFLDGMPGSSLRDAIKAVEGRGLDPISVLRAFSRYAHGLLLMHSRGIYHRDIKPSNLYYPRNNPDDAAIMDLGIARDVNGTVTQGQVPGTLDYMPPEVVTSGSRGEGGMDIYALGLCLYEALTGKNAYPRLPTGSAAYVVFFNRARDKNPPDLEDARRMFGEDMFSLLKEMTEPDLSLRMKDAGTLVRRLGGLIVSMGGTPPVPDVTPSPRITPPPPRSPPRPVPVASPMPQSRPGPTSRPAPVSRPVPVSRPSSAPRQMPMQPMSMRCRNMRIPPALFYVPFVIMVLVAFAVTFWTLFGNAIKVKLAEHELNGVVDAWQKDNVVLAEGREAGWFTRWSAIGYGWRRISGRDFCVLTNRLAVAKAEIRREKAARELEMARMSERRICMERIGACRRRDGSLDEDKYTAIDGWALPEWLNGDHEVGIRLSGLDQSLVTAIKAKLALEPAGTRLARIRSATALLNNSWTPRLLASSDVNKIRSAIETVSKWCVVTVRNACSDLIAIDGIEIAIGGSRVMLFKDGRSDSRTVTRDGCRPMQLPGNLNGKLFEISDAMMEAMPVRVELPFFEEGVKCRIGDWISTSRESVELKPGSYECVYSRDNYEDQRIPFTVHVKVETVVPEPGVWKHTDEYLSRRKRIDESRRRFLSAPVDVSVPRLDSGVVCLLDGEKRGWGTVALKPGTHHYRYEREGFEPQAGTFQLNPGEPVRLAEPAPWETVAAAAERKRNEKLKDMQDVVLARCKELWANEPVQDRQDRLEAAGVRAARAIFDGVLTEAEAKPLFDEINKRKRWAVGRVENKCAIPITVGGRSIAAGTTELLVFETGIPSEWFAEAKGYERKSLLRDFDGCVLSFSESDLVPLDVAVHVPALDVGVTCMFEGSSISGSIRLKPGSYVCVYKKRGYEDQMIHFQVRFGQSMEIPPPSAWKAR